MKNCKGFTLIELLAVITILVILSLIIVPIIDKNVKKSKEDIYSIQIENIRMAGINYFSDNIFIRPDEDDYCSVYLDELVSLGYMSGNAINPKTGNNFSDNYVQITNNGNSDRDSFNYLVCPDETGCENYKGCS